MKRAAIVLLVLSAGCLSTYPGRQRIPVASEPAGAEVQLVCEGVDSSWGATPTSIAVGRNAERCSVILTKRGYDSVTVALVRRYSSAPVQPTISDAIANAALIGVGLFGRGGVHVSMPVTADGRTTEHSKQVPEAIEVVLQPIEGTPP
jgi:hypothetical protein